MGGYIIDTDADKILRKGIREGKHEAYIDLLYDGTITVDVAARKLNTTPDDIQKMLNDYVKEIKQK